VPLGMLGFAERDNASAPADGSSNALFAPFRCSLQKDRYVVLKLTPNAELLTSPLQAVDRTFAILPCTPNLTVNLADSDDAYVKRWTPPLARISRFYVEFTDARGCPYDFQNQDHFLELVLECVVGRQQ